MLHRSIMIVCSAAVALGACRGNSDRDTQLDGEWILRLELVKPSDRVLEPASRHEAGRLVISARIPDYMHDWYSPDEAPPILGRHYLNTHHFLLPIDSAHRLQQGYQLRPLLSTDHAEKLEGRVDSAGTMRLTLRPHITHVGIELEGRVGGDTVSGSWLWYGGNPIHDAQGTFVMHRVPRSEYWDSAHSRSVRAARASEKEWLREMREGA
jgi:hypothetical protein